MVSFGWVASGQVSILPFSWKTISVQSPHTIFQGRPNLKNFQKLTTFPNSLGWECQLGGRGINCNTWQLPFAFPVHQLPLFPLPTIIPLLFALIISITTFTKKEVKLVSLWSQPYWLLARKTSQLINKPSTDGWSPLKWDGIGMDISRQGEI